MSDLPNCPQCDSSFTYQDRDMYICPECAYEWPQSGEVDPDEKVIKDSFTLVCRSVCHTGTFYAQIVQISTCRGNES